MNERMPRFSTNHLDHRRSDPPPEPVRVSRATGFAVKGVLGGVIVIAVAAIAIIAGHRADAAAATGTAAAIVRDGAPLPPLCNLVQNDRWSATEKVVVLKTSDLFSAHNETRRFDPDFVVKRIDSKCDPAESERLIVLDLERLNYAPAVGGGRVNHEIPRDAFQALSTVKRLRPHARVALDGGLSVSWARLLAKTGGAYRHHDEWKADAEEWRRCVELADFWVNSHYRDGRSQQEWKDRLTQFVRLFRETFGERKPLAIFIWHRERLGADRRQEWISREDYVEMGLHAHSLGVAVLAFGLELEADEYARACSYYSALADALDARASTKSAATTAAESSSTSTSPPSSKSHTNR